MRRRAARSPVFPVNVWPPFVDALVLVLAAFVLLMLAAFVVQRGLVSTLRQRDREIVQVRDEKSRIEERLRAMAPRGAIEVEDGKVILQGEVLFDSGSDALRPGGHALMADLGRQLADVLDGEDGHMVLVGGHTDDKPLIQGARFGSNWELSTARALAVARVLIAAGVPPVQVVPAGFGEHHPRAGNDDEAGRKQNRRIEVLVVPIKAVSSR